MYRTDFWILWEKVRVGCLERTASKRVYYLGWNRSPAQAGCMRQVLRPGALGRPRGIGWRGRWEGGLGWGMHVTPWLIHVNVWQKPRQYCKVISLQLIKINGKKKRNLVFRYLEADKFMIKAPAGSVSGGKGHRREKGTLSGLFSKDTIPFMKWLGFSIWMWGDTKV